jgi:hypothetical protein
MMLADAEVAVGYFSAVLFFVACGWIPIVFTLFLAVCGVCGFFGDWLVYHDPIDLGILIFPLGLSAPFFWAGWWSLARMKKNRLQRTSN